VLDLGRQTQEVAAVDDEAVAPARGWDDEIASHTQ
jgi:hypothetical protein